MAHPRTLVIQVGRTASRNYQSVKFDAMLTLDMEPEEDPLATLQGWHAALQQQIDELLPDPDPQPKFNGPVTDEFSGYEPRKGR